MESGIKDFIIYKGGRTYQIIKDTKGMPITNTKSANFLKQIVSVWRKRALPSGNSKFNITRNCVAGLIYFKLLGMQ